MSLGHRLAGPGCLALSLLLALPTPTAARRAKSSAVESEAQHLLQQGIAALISRDFAGAAQALTSAFRKAPQPELLYYLGTLAQAEGRALDAQDLMRRYLADPHRDPTPTPEQREAERILRLTRPAHGKLQVVGSDDSLLFVDGRLVGNLPLAQPLLLAPGKHQVVLESGSERYEESVQIQLARFVELRYSVETHSVVLSTIPVLLLVEDYGEQTATEKPLRQAIDQAIQSEHYSVLRPPAALESSADNRLAACLTSDGCQAQLAQESGADYVLRLRLSGSRPSGVTLSVNLLHAAVGESAAHAALRCPGSCSGSDASMLYQQLLPGLLDEAKKRRFGRLAIESTPTGAELYRGSQRLGLTPVELALWAGPVELELRRPGSTPERYKANIVDGQRATVHVTLHPLLGSLADLHWVRPPRPRWRYFAGAATVGASLLLLGLGGSALAANGSCVDPPAAPGDQCLRVHATVAVGGSLVGVGLGVALAGGLLIGLPSPRRLVAGPDGGP